LPDQPPSSPRRTFDRLGERQPGGHPAGLDGDRGKGAREEIGVLVYAAPFLAKDATARTVLAELE
jgi:hypothetical protein